MNNPLNGINRGKVTKGIVIFLAAASLITVTAIKTIEVANKVKAAMPAMVFAYNNPELVEPVRNQYEIEFNELKDSIIKRQSITGSTESASPKE